MSSLAAPESQTFAGLRPAAVLAAAHRLRPVITRTPLRRSAALEELVGGAVFLKLESEQLTGSFKVRGAFNAVASLGEQARGRGVVASSAGNHGLAVAWAARHFGIPARIFIPASAPEIKRRGIESFGATVDREAPHYDAARERATAYAAEHGLAFLDPCSGDALIAGQGTVALEILEELPQPASLVVPVGGGGLLAGVASLVRHVSPGTRILGAQSVNTAAMARSLEAGRVVPIENVPTLADGLAGGIDAFALDVGTHALDELVTVEEAALERAIAWLARHERVVVEGAGAAGVAAILAGRLEVREPTAVILSGRNIDAARHAAVLARVARS